MKFLIKYLWLRKILYMFIISIVSNCTVAAPFQKSSRFEQYNITENTEVLVALTEVEIHGSIFDQFTFWRRVTSVRGSLEENKGYLGVTIRREIFGSMAWTMTVWKDESSLEDFVYSREHERAMKDGAPAVKRGRFFRIKKQWKDLPMPWEEATHLVHEEGRVE